MFTFLEFNKGTIDLSYMVYNIRQENYEKEKKEMKARKGISGFAGKLVGGVGQIVGGGVELG